MTLIDKRNYLFDNLKGFLIICVIIGNSLEYANPTSIDLNYFILFLYIFHMPLFAFISGYFNIRSKRTTQEKVISILKIYLFAQIFYFLANKLLFGDLNSKINFFAPTWTMWYFISLMSWYIISDFIKNKKRWFIISILISLYVGFDQSIGSYASISRTFFFLPYFIAGMGFKEEYFEKLRKYKYKLAIVSVVFFIILYSVSDFVPVELFFEYTNYSTYSDSSLFAFIIRIFHYISSFVVIAFLIGVAPKTRTSLSKIGQASLVLYVSHGFIIKLLYKYSPINYSTPLNILMAELAILILTITVSILLIALSSIIKKRKV
ncbi:acyltransferase family protein [Clostridium vincentii]|uniref:Acyltransferase family protein n=1 Tax=Clostridium vincentii TaxID=52704 RepID=A0A2T0B916_9CLOT|nr:acyltransferase family protein [Clostridium vincentii]PRR80287.1 Acyltransferase family protein [Clostridium vincentii]